MDQQQQQQQQQPQEPQVRMVSVKTFSGDLEKDSFQPCTLRRTETPKGEPCYEIERDLKLTVTANVHEGAFLAVAIERYHDDPKTVLPLTLDDVAYTLRYPFKPEGEVSPGQVFRSSVSFTLVPYYLSREGCTPEFHKLINFAHVKTMLVDNEVPLGGFRFISKIIYCRELYFGPIPEEYRHLFPSESSSVPLESGQEQQQEEDTSMDTPTEDLPHSMDDLSISNPPRHQSLLTSH